MTRNFIIHVFKNHMFICSYAFRFTLDIIIIIVKTNVIW